MVNIIDTMRSLEGAYPNTYYIQSTRRVRDVSDKIWLLDPDEYALTVLLKKTRKKSATDPKFEWHEDDFPAQRDTITTAGSGVVPTATSDQTFTPDNADRWRKYDVWMHGESGETIFVFGIAAGVVSCIRDVANLDGVGSTWTIDQSTMYYVGNAVETGARARDMVTTQVENKFNYVQLFKEAFMVDNTANWTKLYGGPDLAWQRYKHGILHQRDIEKALWFGQKAKIVYTTDTNNTIETTSFLTGGVLSFIHSSMVFANASGDLTEDEFEANLPSIFRYGGKTKFIFCSPYACSTISTYGREKLQSIPRDETWGIAITRYQSNHGILNIINNKLFQDFTYDGTPTTDVSKMAVVLDLENLFVRVGRDTHLEMNIQENDRDAKKDQYLTELGLEMKLPKTHAQITGFEFIN
jgi:hypothetical protein